jgi:hypothetical protein
MRKLLLVGLVGCSTTASSGFEIKGSVTGTSPPASGQVLMLWDLVDTAYKWGDGTATATSYAITLDTDPPAGAILPGGLAVGYVVLVADGTNVPDGPYTSATLNFPILGITSDTAIIWRDALGSGAGLSWEAAFGARSSCGHGVRQTTGHDTFELTPCANMTIDAGAALASACNWN